MHFALRLVSTIHKKEAVAFLTTLFEAEDECKYFSYTTAQDIDCITDVDMYLFYVDEKPAGCLLFRNSLQDESHGHLEYILSSTMRGKGYGSLLLKEGLHLAKQAGIDRVLLLSPTASIPSCKVIEDHDGRFWKEVADTTFYWIQLGKDVLAPLESKRLSLRLFEEKDLEDFYSYAKEEGVGEMAGWPHHTSIEESKRILNSFLESKQDYAIIDKQTNRVIGSLGVMARYYDPAYQNTKQREIGYVLKKEYWGKGFMSEAVSCVLKYMFEILNVDIVWCSHFTFNHRSVRVIEKAGFQYHHNGVYNAYLLHDTYEEKTYLLTKESYAKQKEVRSIHPKDV